jgi:hypothetical protein
VRLVELDVAVLEGKERPVAAHADILARMQLRTALADEDVARDDGLAAKSLDAEPLRVAFASVGGGSLAFLVRHD